MKGARRLRPSGLRSCGSIAQRRTGLLAFWVVIVLSVPAARVSSKPVPAALTASRVPTRPKGAPSGSQFIASIDGVRGREREERIWRELRRGNVPEFLRHLQPVYLRSEEEDGERVTATVFVTPDYLSIGSDEDFVRIPVDYFTATAVARRFGCVLPTRRIVDAVYQQAAVHLEPQPMYPGPEMTSTAYFCEHNRKIRAQLAGHGFGSLLSGHKKDLVLTNLLLARPGRVAIYGWHRPDGQPIQPLSLVHPASYADYSHGVRLVSEKVLINGVTRNIYDVLADPVLARVLSDEGPITGAEHIMSLRRPPAADHRLAGVDTVPASRLLQQRNPK